MRYYIIAEGLLILPRNYAANLAIFFEIPNISDIRFV